MHGQARADELEEPGDQVDLDREGISQDRRLLERSADLRYFGEAYEVRVPIPAGAIEAGTLRRASEAFHDAHDRLYGYSYRGSQLTEVVNLRVTGVGIIDKPAVVEEPESEGAAQPASQREVYFDGGFVSTPVYSRRELTPGMSIDGPAIVEEYGSTTVIQPGQRAAIDRWRNLVLGERP